MKMHGIVKGRTIELDEAFGLVDGERVEVEVRVLDNGTRADDRLNGSAKPWTYIRLLDDRPEMPSEIDFSKIKRTVTVINAGELDLKLPQADTN